MSESPDQGPFLIVAALAPKAFHAPDGRIAGVNEIAHHILIANQGTDEMPALTVKLQAVLLLIAGQARGKSFTIAIQAETPSSKRLLREDLPFEFNDHEQAAASITLELQTAIEEEGHYWFDVILAPRGRDGDEHVLTRMPLMVTYQRDSP